MLKPLLLSALISVCLSSLVVQAAVVPLYTPNAQASAEKTSPFNAKMGAAFDAIRNKNLVAARAALTQAQKLRPKSIDVQLMFAEVARLANKPAEIEAALLRAQELDARNPDVMAAWARWHFAKGNLDAAEAELRRAIQVKPDYARLHIDLGDLYLNGRHQHAEAVSAYQQAIVLDAKSAGAHAGLGAALLAQGDKKGAIIAFEKSAELAPANPLPLIALGRIQVSLKQYKHAEGNFAKVLTLQPGLVSIMLERADALLLDGQQATAIAAYKEAIKQAPDDAVAHGKLGMALHQFGEPAAAFAAYEQALRLQPNSPLILNNLAVLAIESKTRVPEAENWARKATELAPNVATYLDTRAWVLQASGKSADALSVLDKGMARLAPSAQLQYRRGLILEETAKPREAIEAYRSALAIEPDFEFALDAKKRLAKLAQ